MNFAITDRIVGALTGLALGDALGAPVEWLDHATIAQRHPRGVTDFLADPARNIAVGQVTDDAEMAFVTARALAASRRLQMDELAASLAAWGHGRTDLGASTAAGIAAVRAGTHWSLAGSEKSPSSGCLPRCAPVALLVPLTRVETDTADCCRVTHRHPLALAATSLLNTLVARLVRGESWSRATASFVPGDRGGELAAAWTSLVAAIRSGSGAVDGAPAVLVEAVRCVAGAADAESAVVAAVSLGGDSDTRGAVAGLLAGALWGYGGLPRRWVAQCPAAIEARQLGLALSAVGGHYVH